jgi:hypothetical protein
MFVAMREKMILETEARGVKGGQARLDWWREAG